MPLPDATSLKLSDAERAVYDAGAIFASLGFFGMIWLTADLIVKDTYGWIVDFVTIGRPVTDSVLPLIGLEAEIKSLEQYPDRQIELPVVGTATAEGPAHKLNFTCFWNGADDCPIALVYRSTSQSELEIELSRQIRARLMAESAVIETSKELTRANADLESFASIVSHDLKTPLRHMRHLADAAYEDALVSNHGGITARLRDIQRQALHMSRMLSALFDYSSLGRKSEAIEAVDTRALVEAICETLPTADFTVTMSGDWPTLMTMRAPFDLVVRNLIANAIAHHDRDSGAIEVCCREQSNALEIAVLDDGPGIDVRHHDTIFLPFRSLSRDPVSPTTGMGLAMVKRTLQSVGGSIAVEATPPGRRGATFTVMWPKTDTA